MQNHPLHPFSVPRGLLPCQRGFRGFSVRGFTLIELLVVIAIVIVLIGILLVTLRAATRAAYGSNTQALMTSIEKGLVEFKETLGYLPPVLGPLDDTRSVTDMDDFRRYKRPPAGPEDTTPAPGALAYDDNIQDWYSFTTIAEYLIGYGPANEDGADGLGIRSPLDDGYWGVAFSIGDPNCAAFPIGSLGARRCFLDSDDSLAIRSGKILGPFLELRDSRLLGAIADVDDDTGELKIVFPGEGGYNDTLPKVVVDYWGRPIRYYRSMYRPGSLGLPYRGFTVAGLSGQQVPAEPPTLADVFVLRPWEVVVGSGITATQDYGDDDLGDRTTTNELKRAPFALLSSGPDRQLNEDVRRDTEPSPGEFAGEFNKDNIIEVAK